MASTFTLYPLLPTELRLQIWQHTFPSPRQVRISRWASGPPALYVNHESRDFVKQFYDLIPRPAARRIFSCYGWMNLSLDIVDGEGFRELHYLPGHEESCKKIRHIQIDVATHLELFRSQFFINKLENSKSTFANLEHVDVVVHEHASNSAQTVEDVIDILKRKMTELVREVETDRSVEGKQWQLPTFTVDLCSSTKDSITTLTGRECLDIYCDIQF